MTKRRVNDIMTAAAILAMPHGPDRAEVETFRRFLTHHGRPTRKPGGAICGCGVGARLEPDGSVSAVPNPDCECPCHESGYAVGKSVSGGSNG